MPRLIVLVLFALPILPGCGDSVPRAGLLRDVTAELGLPTEVTNLPDGQYRSREIMGGGVGVLDYDGDGDLDIVQTLGAPAGQPDQPAPNRLFRQEADGTFLDVTAASGLGDPGDGMGVACGDIDNDGDVDVYFANFGRDALYRNLGDGTFVNITEEAGLRADRWTCSAAFVDYDGDQDLDLFAVHYVDYDQHLDCSGEDTRPEYCGPLEYGPILDSLWQNDGSGGFTDVTAQVGIDVPGTGLGIVCTDLTGDDIVDIYVANDAQANHLWVVQADATVREEGLVRGVGVNRHGKPEASMGVALGDCDGDGVLDLFMTHLSEENNTLYTSFGQGSFEDTSVRSGLSMHDLGATGFGCGFLDLEHDGDLDLAIMNGRVKRGPVHPDARMGPFWNDYAEQDFLFLNEGGGRFVDAGEGRGDFGVVPRVGRGLALGDLDQDGDVDLVSGYFGGSLRVYRNDAPKNGHWLRIRVQTAGRDAIGATVIATIGDRRRTAACLAATSYASSHEPVVHFGLGDATHVDSIEVLWPDRRRERFAAVDVDQEVILVQGTGEDA